LEVNRLEVVSARERLENLRRGPDQLTIDTAAAAVDSARNAVENAEARVRDLQAPPPADRVAPARAAADSARNAVENAEARVRDLQAPPLAHQVAAARSAVNAAQASLAVAVARHQALTDGSSRNGQREVGDRMAAAQSGLDSARAGGMPPEDNELRNLDLMLLEKTIEQDRAGVATLERELAATYLRAPFAGTVVAVQVAAGDPVDRQTPVVVLAHPVEPVLRVDLDSRDAGRLAVGQQAAVQLDGADGLELNASVAALNESEEGRRSALFQVAWPTPPPVLGTTAQVAVTLRVKENVLLVPQRAVRSAGARRYVQLVASGTQRNAPVEVGIVADGYAEILSGLRDLQLVRVGS
jgi:multidrug resistance efflux pump